MASSQINTGTQIPVEVLPSSLRVLATRAAPCQAFIHDRTILLLFWHRTFSRLRQLARALMCVPATSVPAEKKFSGWQDLL